MLDSVLRRLEVANQALFKTVGKEARETIQAQLTELKLEKDLIVAKIEVRNKMNSVLHRLQEANQALYKTVD